MYSTPRGKFLQFFLFWGCQSIVILFFAIVVRVWEFFFSFLVCIPMVISNMCSSSDLLTLISNCVLLFSSFYGQTYCFFQKLANWRKIFLTDNLCNTFTLQRDLPGIDLTVVAREQHVEAQLGSMLYYLIHLPTFG